MSFTPPDFTTRLIDDTREAALVEFASGQRAIALEGMGLVGADNTSPPMNACGNAICPANSAGSNAWQIRLADIPYNRVLPPFYHVAVRVSTPLLLGAALGCTELVGSDPPRFVCGSMDSEGEALFDTPRLHGEVAVAGNGTFVEASGAALSREFDENVLAPSDAQKEWPDVDPSSSTTQGTAYLVNPGVAPWPSPDDLGNTFGRCLFTAAQLPAAVDLAISRYNRSYVGAGTFVVEIGAYLIGRRLRGRTVVLPASPGRRRRRRIVGQGGSLIRQTVAQGTSGVGIPVPEPAGWRRIFADDFETPVALGSFPAAAPKWGAYNPTWTGSAGNSFYDARKTVSIHDGVLDVWCHTADGDRVTAAPVPRLPVDPAVEASGVDGMWSGYYTMSARIAVRVKATPMPGYKTAFLLWPKSDIWPRDGEIDMPEGDLRDGHHVGGFMHRQDGVNGGDQETFDGGIVYADGEWHTYVIEWRAGESCQFFVDGVAGPRWTSRVPATPMRYVMQIETEYLGLVPGPEIEGHIYVDWITYAVAA